MSYKHFFKSQKAWQNGRKISVPCRPVPTRRSPAFWFFFTGTRCEHAWSLTTDYWQEERMQSGRPLMKTIVSNSNGISLSETVKIRRPALNSPWNISPCEQRMIPLPCGVVAISWEQVRYPTSISPIGSLWWLVSPPFHVITCVEHLATCVNNNWSWSW